MNELESIYNNAFSLALWDGKSNVEAEVEAELAVMQRFENEPQSTNKLGSEVDEYRRSSP